jgi:hypothetical protein
MKNRKPVILSLILIAYALLYIATKPNFPCEGDCAKVQAVDSTIRKGRESYVLGTVRCSWGYVSDTLCVYVKDTSGVNWNLLADTTCIIATQSGLLQQKVFILKSNTYPPDTLARKICP